MKLSRFYLIFSAVGLLPIALSYGVDPGSAPSSGVTQEVLGPFLEGEQEQSGR